ncbi:DUF6531 domain-containing protein [Streptomyces sp. SID3343]|uniref:DUF6531 domain-containing protein n=1 Tax=Streptomyces sp. SID3343 TaxID=2690260 RepID=UPI0013705069|nr:DUF6531 domain-containing protein [Streptomyces sp. SID3343]MYW03768.1 hypothetical protein [Streptomyces sp. SID3343]
MGKNKNRIPAGSTAESLIPGNWQALERLAGQLSTYAGRSKDAAGRLGTMSAAESWSGEAAEGFRKQMSGLPKTLTKGAGAFQKAASALLVYAMELRTAQDTARSELIPAADQARAQSAQYDAAKSDYKAAVERGDDKTMSLAKPPDDDPGDSAMKDAERRLGRLRDDLGDAEHACMRVLEDGADDAPEGQSPWKTMYEGIKEIGGGAKDATFDLASSAWKTSSIRAAIDPKGYLTDLTATAEGLKYATTHPIEFAKAAVNWDEWRKNPLRAGGMMIPDLIITAATGGAGKLPSAITKVDKLVPGDGKPDHHPDADPNHHPDADPDCRGQDSCGLAGEPVDMATGEMVLDQTDVTLPGALPLVLRRRHRTHFTAGRWFGERWASTLDQHLELGPHGVRFTAADGVVLRYPMPEAGASVLPFGGSRWPLVRTDASFTVTDPRRGWTWSFASLPGVASTRMPLRSLSDRNGNRIDYRYDDAGVPCEVTHTGGYRIAVDSVAGLVTGLRLLGADPETHLCTDDPSASVPLIRFGYDDSGDLTDITNSSGRPLRYTYDPQHRITSWTDRNDTWYQYEYDEAGRCVHGWGSDGIMDNTFDYDTVTRVTRMTDALDAVREFEHDDWGLIVRETDPLGGETRTEWDAYNRRTAVTDPLGHTTRLAYDDLGNPTGTVNPDGTFTVADYHPTLCRPVTITGPDRRHRRYTYDERGNALTHTDAAGAVTTYTYDGAGHMTSITDALGHTTRSTSDAAGLPLTVTNPLAATTTVTRNAFGRIVTSTDPLGHTTRTGWTTEGKPAWRERADGARESWTWDSEGNLRRHLNAAGFATR